MPSLKSIVGAVALAAAFFSFATPGVAQPRRINALVMLEDASPETMARVVPIYRRILAPLQETLNTRNIQVYDENSSAMIFQRPNARRRSDVELVTIAREISQRTPLDVVVLFEIVASVQKDPVVPTIVRPRVRLPGRILNVRSGQFIGAFEVDAPQMRALPNPCDEVCLYETVGSDARLLVADLATALAQKLEGFSVASGPVAVPLQMAPPANLPPQAQAPAGPSGQRCDSMSGEVVIRVVNFESDELTEIERNLRGFGCFEELRPTQTGAKSAEYQYRSRLGMDRINRNLVVMLDFLDLKGQVRYDRAGFEVSKVQTRN